MTVEKILVKGLIEYNAEVFIRDSEMRTIARGKWFQDHVLAHINDEVGSFTWQNDNKIFIDVI